MIHYIEHKNIDKQKWDTCITASDNVNPFVYSWYLDVVCENWSALILNDYEAIFPLAVKSKYGLKYLYQPFFTRYFGLFSKAKMSTKQLNEFLEGISNDYKFAEFCLHESHKTIGTTFQLKEKKYQLLDLSIEYSFLHKDFSTNAIRNVKKGEKANYIITNKISAKEIVDLFKKTKGGELAVFKPKDYEALIQLMEQCLALKKGITYAVQDASKNLIAAAFFIKTNNRFTFLKSGVTDSGKENGAMHFLFNTFIKEHANTNYILDFGGSSVDSVARFYKNFGAKDCVYLQLKQNKLPKLLKLIKK